VIDAKPTDGFSLLEYIDNAPGAKRRECELCERNQGACLVHRFREHAASLGKESRATPSRLGVFRKPSFA
jgi:hypothetical protein